MVNSKQHSNPEIWGGIECTINRIGNTYRDQLEYADHYNRTNDIDIIASLGIRALRYPVLWERHFPLTVENKKRWEWTSEQLEKIREYNISPIVGLVHHGSGPYFTSLMNDSFPEGVAEHASMVAQQFPWIEYYTPINEPLTTARFSGLYGFWFPHHSDEVSFATMLLNQLKAVVLTMKAIRNVNPFAKLVQTEDLAYTHSTDLLKYQADFENKRRWLTFDILCAKVTTTHFFWNYFISLGIEKHVLQFFLDNPCPPDVIGLNYYVTSERYLDERIHLYPASFHGGNAYEKYADVSAVHYVKPAGLKNLLTEAWERYHLPMALTEIHINCTREEQLRWFNEAWNISCGLTKNGINIKAVTAWSLLGAFDWNSLLTLEEKRYEAGAFDIVNNVLRPTALVKLFHSLDKTGTYNHPLLTEHGWWHKNIPENNISKSSSAPLLIIGKNGTLGNGLQRICKHRSITFIALDRQNLDITNKEQIEKAIDTYKPWAVINAAGYVRVDDAESDSENCFNVNAYAAHLLADSCKRKGIYFMTFSTDLVFDGNKISPYVESDDVQPLNIYGKSKVKAETLVLKINPSSLIIRTSAFFGPWDNYNFPAYILNSLKDNNSCSVVKDIIVSPTYIPDLINAALDLFIDEEEGIWHICNEGNISWANFACNIADRAGFSKDKLILSSSNEMNWKAKRPLYSALQSSKGISLPKLENAITRFFEEKII